MLDRFASLKKPEMFGRCNWRLWTSRRTTMRSTFGKPTPLSLHPARAINVFCKPPAPECRHLEANTTRRSILDGNLTKRLTTQ